MVEGRTVFSRHVARTIASSCERQLRIKLTHVRHPWGVIPTGKARHHVGISIVTCGSPRCSAGIWVTL